MSIKGEPVKYKYQTSLCLTGVHRELISYLEIKYGGKLIVNISVDVI
jgi:hypothetical protein